jgi:hypothetical protein
MALRLSRRETGRMRLGKPIFRIDIESILIVEYHPEHPHSFTFFCPLLDLEGRSKFWRRQIILSFFAAGRKGSCLGQQSALSWPFRYLSDTRKVLLHSRFTNYRISYQDVKSNHMGGGFDFLRFGRRTFPAGTCDMSHRPTVYAIGALHCSSNFSFPCENIFKIIVFSTLETHDITEKQITSPGVGSLSVSQPNESQRRGEQNTALSN